MQKFSDHIINGGTIPKELLGKVIDRYPWFSTAKYCVDLIATANDPLVVLTLLTKPTPRPLLSEIHKSDFQTLSTLDIIDTFLDKGEYRVIPKDDTPDCDLTASESMKIDDDNEVLTEDLAEIYLNQGLKDQAREIYSKLCLVYPEKSVYFAEIIAKIDSK